MRLKLIIFLASAALIIAAPLEPSLGRGVQDAARYAGAGANAALHGAADTIGRTPHDAKKILKKVVGGKLFKVLLGQFLKRDVVNPIQNPTAPTPDPDGSLPNIGGLKVDRPLGLRTRDLSKAREILGRLRKRSEKFMPAETALTSSDVLPPVLSGINKQVRSLRTPKKIDSAVGIELADVKVDMHMPEEQTQEVNAVTSNLSKRLKDSILRPCGPRACEDDELFRLDGDNSLAMGIKRILTLPSFIGFFDKAGLPQNDALKSNSVAEFLGAIESIAKEAEAAAILIEKFELAEKHSGLSS
ncbi:hypothetical protein H072_440 [Dactylellina haptotyla CBS 200.50]|uniref:Uncharacterized protein n=1 Tax=Dactylellina haptotyla (strain CBS 200.50) TaxID=1284197 RepID=S8ARB5_DACHA|nr:hypothetical protein H072_440 [Dactylellina haptotyla CBS 200.50]